MNKGTSCTDGLSLPGLILLLGTVLGHGGVGGVLVVLEDLDLFPNTQVDLSLDQLIDLLPVALLGKVHHPQVLDLLF